MLINSSSHIRSLLVSHTATSSEILMLISLLTKQVIDICHFCVSAMMSHPPIPIAQLADHIEHLKANDGLKFSHEYESIEPGQQFTWDNSNMEVNKPKNRYANVIAYDHSRIILQAENGVAGSDYINANYMDGYRKQNAYIATQGPLPETFSDFWRMVWEQRSASVVMMTKLEERTRVSDLSANRQSQWHTCLAPSPCNAEV